MKRPWTWLRRIGGLYFGLAAALVVLGYVFALCAVAFSYGTGLIKVAMFLTVNAAALLASLIPLAVGAALERLDYAAWSAGRAAEEIRWLSERVNHELEPDDQTVGARLETIRRAALIVAKAHQPRKRGE